MGHFNCTKKSNQQSSLYRALIYRHDINFENNKDNNDSDNDNDDNNNSNNNINNNNDDDDDDDDNNIFLYSAYLHVIISALHFIGSVLKYKCKYIGTSLVR